MKLRGISTPLYAPGDPPRLRWEPVFVCDSRFLCTMLLRAWREDAQVEMRRQLYREMYPDSSNAGLSLDV